MNEDKNQESHDGEGAGNGKRNGRKITKHHLVPRSRGGSELKYNVVRIPERYHEAWHMFFGNLTPKEAIQFIRTVFAGKGKKRPKWTVDDLYELQLEIQQGSFKK